MKIAPVNNPGTKAEGHCNGLPYNTELVSDQGCQIHFWVGVRPDTLQLHTALRTAQNSRDIISASWSTGGPDGFWARNDIK